MVGIKTVADVPLDSSAPSLLGSLFSSSCFTVSTFSNLRMAFSDSTLQLSFRWSNHSILIITSTFLAIFHDNPHIIMSAQLAPLSSLVMFLVQPLIQSRCPASAIMSFHSQLNLNLSPFFSSEVQNPFSFTLSSSALPPAPIYKAIVAAGVAWKAWCGAFCERYNGRDVEILVCPLEIKLRPVGTDAIYRIWARRPAERQYLEVPSIARSSFGYKLPNYGQVAGLVHMGNVIQPGGIIVPSLFVTPPSSPPGLTRPLPELSFSLSDSDSESSGSEDSSSTPATSPESVPCDLPEEEETPKPSLPLPEAPRLSRRERRRFVDRSKAQPTQYLYQGGATNVVGGGVMLGGVFPRPSRSTAPIRSNNARLSSPSLPKRPDASSNWRQRS